MAASRLRVAAGAGLLSVGLLIGSSGGAVALADPDSSASTAHEPRGARESNQVSGPAGKVADTLRKAVDDIAGAVTAGRKPSRPQSTVAGSTAAGTGHPRTSGRRSASLPTAPTPAIPNAASSTPTSAPSVPNPTASAPAAAATVPNLAGAISTTVVTSLDRIGTTVTSVVAAVPVVGAPASDVIGGVQDLLTTVVGSVGEVPSSAPSLPALMGVGSRNPLAAPGRANIVGPPAADTVMPVAPRLSQSPEVPLALSTAEVRVVAQATAGVAALSVSGQASLPRKDTPADGAFGSFLEQAFREIAAHLSLAALALAALPGLGGLLILTSAGIRIGYRQAKANFVLRTNNVARFAAQGPIGIVRSGSLISIGSRRLRALAPVPAEGLLDQVA